MSKGTVFNYLRYLAARVVENKSKELSKEELQKELADEELFFIGTNLDCAYTLYLKYIEEYKVEQDYEMNFK